MSEDLDKINNNAENSGENQVDEAVGGGVDLSILEGLSFKTKWSGYQEAGVAPSKKPFKKNSGPRDFKGKPRFNKDRDGNKRPPRKPGERPARTGRSGRFDKTQREFEPTVEVNFYPEDDPFATLCKAMRSTCRTYELFEVAHLILEKPDRFVAVIKAKKEGEKFFVSPFDNVPFETEQEAIGYSLKEHIGKFFHVEEIEREAPKGNFPMISKCGVTGEPLGPPNYHRYQELIRQHYENHIHGMSFERFQSKIQSVRDEEVVQAWLDKMKKGQRYTLKQPGDEEVKKAPEAVAENEVKAEDVEPQEDVQAPEVAEKSNEPKKNALVLESWEDVRAYMLANHKKDLVKIKDQIRIPGVLIEKMPRGNIRRSIEHMLAKQRAFPLVTANNIRGRMRRMKFAVYKRKDKAGKTYVSAVKPNTRTESTAFSDSLKKLILFLDGHAGILVTDLPIKYLGVEQPEAKEGEEAKLLELTPEQQAESKKVLLDLRWLVAEGYVTEFGDGSLSANPKVQEEAPKPQEVPKEEKPSNIVPLEQEVQEDIEEAEELDIEIELEEDIDAEESNEEKPE